MKQLDDVNELYVREAVKFKALSLSVFFFFEILAKKLRIYTVDTGNNQLRCKNKRERERIFFILALSRHCLLDLYWRKIYISKWKCDSSESVKQTISSAVLFYCCTCTVILYRKHFCSESNSTKFLVILTFENSDRQYIRFSRVPVYQHYYNIFFLASFLNFLI